MQVQAWSLSDQLLYQGQDLNTRYFGAQTLRAKIQVRETAIAPKEFYIILFELNYLTYSRLLKSFPRTPILLYGIRYFIIYLTLQPRLKSLL